MSIVIFVPCLVVPCLVEAVHAPVSIEHFSVHIENLLANDKYGFSEEYKVNAIILTAFNFYILIVLGLTLIC